MSVIARLDESVINMIAAGEYVIRPLSVVKELLENSMDAESTQISVTIKSGGMKSIQISDNGTGIALSDLELLCTRFCTSKIREYDDLKTVDSYGFRGEALASISHVARVSVSTRREEDAHGYYAKYLDGALLGSPIPKACNKGTTTVVEDLFYNNALRKKSLKNANDEYQKSLDVVAKYAVLHDEVTFMCKRAGEKGSDLNTQGIDRRGILKRILRKESIEMRDLRASAKDCEIVGLVSPPGVSYKRLIFILFINGRLVKCQPLKRAITWQYSMHLSKGTFPIVFLSLNMPGKSVDVNVHPSKDEVKFLFEETITTAISDSVKEILEAESSSRYLPMVPQGQNSAFSRSINQNQLHSQSRSQSQSQNQPLFAQGNSTAAQSQIKIPSASSRGDVLSALQGSSEYARRAPPRLMQEMPRKRVTANQSGEMVRNNSKRVRTDAQLGNLDAFIAGNTYNISPTKEKAISAIGIKKPTDTSKPNNFRDLNLASIESLKEEVTRDTDWRLRDLLRAMVLVGCVDTRYTLAQFGEDLCALDIPRLSAELFYQLCLICMGNFSYILLTPPPRICDYIVMLGVKEEEAKSYEKILLLNKAMLKDYFSITISDEGLLQTLPVVTDGYTPQFMFLPELLRSLAKDVEWEYELDCIRGICRYIAEFYAIHIQVNSMKGEGEIEPQKFDPEKSDANPFPSEEELLDTIRRVIFPLLKSGFNVPLDFATNGAIVRISNIAQLYKQFERC